MNRCYNNDIPEGTEEAKIVVIAEGPKNYCFLINKFMSLVMKASINHTNVINPYSGNVIPESVIQAITAKYYRLENYQ